jgi:hypothetical protein
LAARIDDDFGIRATSIQAGPLCTWLLHNGPVSVCQRASIGIAADRTSFIVGKSPRSRCVPFYISSREKLPDAIKLVDAFRDRR